MPGPAGSQSQSQQPQTDQKKQQQPQEEAPFYDSEDDEEFAEEIEAAVADKIQFDSDMQALINEQLALSGTAMSAEAFRQLVDEIAAGGSGSS